MNVLYIHGMMMRPISGYLMLKQLQKDGFDTQTFGYISAIESFESIVKRLQIHLDNMAKQGSYIVIAHSLGGVLLRAALAGEYNKEGKRSPEHVYLLGSPQVPSTWARIFSKNLLFKVATGDCGQLLGSDERMSNVGQLNVPTTAILGTVGLPRIISPFRNEQNDGIVSESEAKAPWIKRVLHVRVSHTFLPMSREVGQIIIDDLGMADKRKARPF